MPEKLTGPELTEKEKPRVKVTVVGAGNMGRGIGQVLVRGGHSVTVVDRDPEEAGRLIEQLRGAARGGATVEAEAPGAGVSDEVVILAVWYPSSLEAARELGGELEGKVVVDISNPVNQTFDGLAAGARVVKAFNTTFAGTLVEGEVAGQPLDVFIAGHDEGAKEIVAQLARDGGLRAIDVGPLERARYLEGLGFLHMMVQQPLGTGFASAAKVIS